MAEYRAYTVGLNGHFIGFDAFECSDDPEAIKMAKRMIDGHAIELWQGERFVVRLESPGEVRPPQSNARER
jgi:hypothetical protein